MAAHFEDGENMTDMPPVHTKMAHILPADFVNGKFREQNLNRHILTTALFEHSKTMKMKHFSTFSKRS